MQVGKLIDTSNVIASGRPALCCLAAGRPAKDLPTETAQHTTGHYRYQYCRDVVDHLWSGFRDRFWVPQGKGVHLSGIWR
jgi:hypothetical protein